MHSLPAYLKKLSAFLLLGLFLFIQAEKSLHEHNAAARQHTGYTHVSDAKANCLLCDFQLAADADVPALSFELNPVRFTAVHAVFHNPVYFSSSAHVSALRGPPSCC